MPDKFQKGAGSGRIARIVASFLPGRRRVPLLTGRDELCTEFQQFPVHSLPLLAPAPAGAKALAEFASIGARGEQHEAYLGALQALGAHTASNQVWMVASAHAGAGGASTAAALAGLCAAQGRRVVLVDANLRKRRFHGAFGIAPQPGLADILQNEGSWPMTLTPLEAHRFLLLPAGAVRLDVNALARPALAATLQELRAYYDLVLVVLPAQAFAIPGVLAQGDRALVVARAGHTPLPTYEAQLRAALAEQPVTSAVVVEDLVNAP